MVRRLILICISMGATALMFNNCGIGFSAKGGNPGSGSLGLGSTSLGLCLDQLKAVYATTYHPFLKANCNGCHANGHGSNDVSASFTSFMNYPTSTIDYQSTHAHGGNTLGPQIQPQIDAFKPAWNAGQSAYVACEASKGTTGGIIDLPLVEKMATTIETTRTNANTWVTLTWNTGTEPFANAMLNKMPGTFVIETRYLTQGTVAAGFQFRNPRLTLTSGTITLGGLGLNLNGVEMQNFTTYKTLNATVTAGTAVALAPGFGAAIAAYAIASPTTKISLILKTIGGLDGAVGGGGGGTPTPTPSPTPGAGVTTFTQLTAAGGVFAVSCASCHNAANPQGALDITNITQARAKAALINARMNNAGAPMPTTGLLPQAQRNLVASWVNGGTPQ